jgi:hypothetical protein
MSPATTESARWRRYLGAGGWGVILTVLTISFEVRSQTTLRNASVRRGAANLIAVDRYDLNLREFDEQLPVPSESAVES